jgi:hypothetical protein
MEAPNDNGELDSKREHFKRNQKMTEKKVSKLKAKDPKDTEPSKPKIMIIGAPGVGKTYTSLDFPTSYYYDTEGGANRSHYTDKLKKSGGVYMGPEDGTLDSQTLIDQLQALATEEHPYKTLIIDSISKIFNKIITDESERLKDKDVFGASKKPAIAWMKRVVNWINKLDMSVIFIAHEKTNWVDGESEGVTADVWDKLEYELDLSMRIQKQGASRVAIPRKSRLLGFEEGKSFPWSYEEFAARYGKDVIERKAKIIVLATPEQVAQIKLLLEHMKVTDEQIAKMYSQAGVTDWSEMTTESIEKAINYFKSKITQTGEK